jgi:hypothetical protein
VVVIEVIRAERWCAMRDPSGSARTVGLKTPIVMNFGARRDILVVEVPCRAGAILESSPGSAGQTPTPR